MLHEKKEKSIYLNVGHETLADDSIKNATFRKTVDENTPGAVRRDWVSKDGKERGTKYEKHYGKLSGKITGISFYTGKYGKNLLVEITDGDEVVTLSIKSNSEYANSLMTKIPNIDLSKDVELIPYAFMDEKKNKAQKGITVIQDGNKIQTFFYDFATKKNAHGYPEYEYKLDKSGKQKSVSNAEWLLFFAQRNLWLTEYIEENHASSPTVSSPQEDTAEATPDEVFEQAF